MSREIPNKPHPTPNPDGPHAGAANRGSGAGAGFPLHAQDESATDEPRVETFFDERNVIMAGPGDEPDPALKSKSSSDTVLQIAPEKDQIPSFLEERRGEPRTSEVFPVFAAQADGADQPTAAVEATLASSLVEISAVPEPLFAQSLVETSESTVKGTEKSPRELGIRRRSVRRVSHPLGPHFRDELRKRGHPGADVGPLDGPFVPTHRCSTGQRQPG